MDPVILALLAIIATGTVLTTAFVVAVLRGRP
jgi:hypothetical protein